MTAGPLEEESTGDPEGMVTTESNNFPTDIVKIFEHLSLIKQITFKSQQIDDPELEKAEKIKIAEEIFSKSKHTFLMRFGNYLEEQHLADFERLTLTNNSDPEEQTREMSLMIVDFKERLKSRKLLVKNRRYAAMQNLLKEGDYFSEIEMMKRCPELYEDLIGQYLTENEKKARDVYDVRNTTFSGILMHTMDRQEMNEVMAEVAKQNKKERKEIDKTLAKDHQNNEAEEILLSNQDSQSSNISSLAEKEDEEDDLNDVPVNCRQQWGNFDNEQVACSTSRPINPKARILKSKKTEKNKEDFITAGERDLLRQEFFGIMQEKFLSGEDEDFDYASVDDNSKLDDLKLINQDKEDAYFEESDDELQHSTAAQSERETMDDEESEDELDIYMRHLSQHHSLQNG